MAKKYFLNLLITLKVTYPQELISLLKEINNLDYLWLQRKDIWRILQKLSYDNFLVVQSWDFSFVLL